MLKKIRRFVSLPSPARRTALRTFVQKTVGRLRYGGPLSACGGVTYSAYRPDSVWTFASHPEAEALLNKWVERNRENNSGDLPRFYALVLNVKQILEEGVPGDFAELGVYKGNSAAVLAACAAGAAGARRRLFLFDTFEGFDDRDLVGIDAKKRADFADTSLKRVRELVGHETVCTYVQGRFPESIIEECRERRYAFVHIDCDLYLPAKAALEFFHPRLSPGGTLFLHDYSSGHWPGVKQAADQFCAASGEALVLLPDKSGTAVIRKSRPRRTYSEVP